MSVTVHSYTLLGVQAVPVTIEVDLLSRLSAIVIVGMPSATVWETADRVRSAILGNGFDFPQGRVVVSVSPADLRKSNPTALDLPIAYGILVASGQVAPFDRDVALFGELSLRGEVRRVRGTLAAARCCVADGRVMVGAGAAMAATIKGEGYVLTRLSDLRGTLEAARPILPASAPPELSFADVRVENVQGVLDLLFTAAEAPERRPVVLLGPPGCGKMMIGARAGSLLPEISPGAALQVATIHDAAGLGSEAVACGRPFRAPHHTISVAGLIGNAAGTPGEAVLAHAGVLFLDEYPEFSQAARDAVDVVVQSRRIHPGGFPPGAPSMPAFCWVIVASNPCPCGNRGSARSCVCSSKQVADYLRPVRAFVRRHNAVVVDLRKSKSEDWGGIDED